MAAARSQLVDHTANSATVRIGVRVRVRVRVRCSVYNKTLCRMQWIYYLHDVVYLCI